MRRARNLRRRGRRWYGTFRDASGRRREVAICTDLREAEVILAELARNARRASLGLEDEVRQSSPLDALIDAYCAEGQNRWTPRHGREVAAGLRRMLAGIASVQDVTVERIQRARDRLTGRGGRPLANRTRNKLAGAVVAFLAWAEATRRIGRAPVRAVPELPEGGRHQARRRHRLTLDEAAALQSEADGSPIGDLVAIVIGTGFRLREALALTWADFDGSSLTVRPAVAKSGRGRNNPIAPGLAQRLQRLRERRGVRSGREEDPIILSPRGLPLSRPGAPERCYRWLVALLRRAGIPRDYADGRLDWHALRHSYATWLAAAGVAPRVLQRLMGHSSLAQVDVYVDLDAVPLDSALPALGTVNAATTRQGQTKTMDSRG